MQSLQNVAFLLSEQKRAKRCLNFDRTLNVTTFWNCNWKRKKCSFLLCPQSTTWFSVHDLDYKSHSYCSILYELTSQISIRLDAYALHVCLYVCVCLSCSFHLFRFEFCYHSKFFNDNLPFVDFNESYAVDLRLAFRFILEFYWKPFNLQLKCGFIIGNIIRFSLPGWCMFALYTVSSEFNVDRLRCYRKTNSLNWTICPLSIHCWFTSKNQNKNKNKCSDLKYQPCEVSPVNRSNVICLYNLFEVNVEAVVSVKRIRIVACGEDNRWLTVNNKSK